MHIEVQVALNFVISYLYNKLPRRRVNIFGEELERALKEKFEGHWYPEKPFKGSAFRCLKTGDPVDTVFEKAARESGVPITDILEHLPSELAVWVDPGEVSYRIGEKGIVKILFSECGDVQQPAEDQADREVIKTFNPEAQCFRPIESKPTSPVPEAGSPGGGPFKAPASPPPAFLPRSHHQLTFTTATFAQTKFGSTKLKTNSKRANRMSPTEFSNYIKQRAALQQQQALHSPGRSVSPDYNGIYNNGPGAFYRGGLETYQPEQYQGKLPYVEWPYHGQQVGPQQGPDKQLLESLSNFSLGQPSSQFQHLLVAN